LQWFGSSLCFSLHFVIVEFSVNPGIEKIDLSGIIANLPPFVS